MSLEPFVIHSSHFKNISYTEYIKFNENSKLDRNYINGASTRGGAIYLDFDSDPIFSESTFKNNYSLESCGCIATDGKSLVTFTATHTAFINNSANWEGGCLYSDSCVGLFSQQMATIQGFFFGQTPIFNGNLYSEFISTTKQSKFYKCWTM